MTKQSLLLLAQPGINKDQTSFSTPYYTDGIWTRFVNGFPKKIGGLKQIAETNFPVTGSIAVQLPLDSQKNFKVDIKKNDGDVYVSLFCATTQKISLFILRVYATKEGTIEVEYVLEKDVSPDSKFNKIAPNSSWTFDLITVKSSENSDIKSATNLYVVAHVRRNPWNYVTLNDRDKMDLDESSVFFIPIVPADVNNYNFQPFAASGLENYKVPTDSDNLVHATGGVCVVKNVLMTYGENGYIGWSSDDNYYSFYDSPQEDVDPFSSFVVVGTESFVAGYPVRYGGQIAALFWSTQSVVSMLLTSAGQETTFVPSYISTNVSCLSGRSVISYEPRFFWVGADTFYQFNGSVSEVQNEENKQFFFDNLDFSYAHKVTSFINKKYNEWWVLFPNKSADLYLQDGQCNWAIVYNVSTGKWYDMPFNFSLGLSSSVFLPYPIVAENKTSSSYGQSNYKMYVHDYGWDKKVFSKLEKKDNITLISYASEAIEASFSFQIGGRKDEPYVQRNIVLNKIIWDINQIPQKTTLYGKTQYKYPKLFLEIEKLAYPSSKYDLEINKKKSLFNFYVTDRFKTLQEEASILNIKLGTRELGGNFHMGKSIMEVDFRDNVLETPVTSLIAEGTYGDF